MYFQNVDKLLERSQHEHEMEQLKKEKEAALAEEIQVTKAGNLLPLTINLQQKPKNESIIIDQILRYCSKSGEIALYCLFQTNQNASDLQVGKCYVQTVSFIWN